MNLWLKLGAEGQLQALKEQGLVGDLWVCDDNTSGRKFIGTFFEVGDPTEEVPEALHKLVERVTTEESIFCGLRPDGIYRHEGATLVAKTSIHPTDSIGVVGQSMNISGPNVDAVNRIYSLFRTGELAPEENWGSMPEPEVEDIGEAASTYKD